MKASWASDSDILNDASQYETSNTRLTHVQELNQVDIRGMKNKYFKSINIKCRFIMQ